ncbi:histidinol-phosphatase [Paenibacillus ginsengarvi]|uniref:Histidinol-phosphatase n=1 Tax=Paenibacillus ginsengarvi TaxID=400777 RepID=A0A3B0CLE9_9BACL|nr:histidinol-phosphatase [Paenibacillus ginsengarvi]RKN85187.1 histidinol-phosphatase HisJ family protein [Paenibacillus ginsengarvi]
MKFDLHTHHFRCGHADGTIRDYIEAAISHGLQVIGISDHSPYFAEEEDQPWPGITMATSDFGNYVAEVLKLKEEYKDRIEVLLGVESDFFPEHADVYRRMYDQYPFDYIIGSVHKSDGISIFNKNRWKGMKDGEKVRQKEIYYDLIRQSAQSGMFQILGHIDAMKGYFPAFSEIPTEAVDETLRVIGQCDIAIEINTSGKMKDCGGWYPSDDILERALHYGVAATFGSDSHVPSRVGDEFEEVARRLKEIGFKEWVFFRQKQRCIVPL